MSLDLNKNAVVTGGATGIGLAIARELIGDGWAVTITGRREALLREVADSIGARAVAFDATDPEQVRAALPELPQRVGVLVNNAGANTDFTRDQDADPLLDKKKSWLANYESNVISAVLVTEALSSRLLDDARIITVGSIAGRTGAGGYGAAKAALEAWTAELSGELGRRGITANVVSPGLIDDTDFFAGQLSPQRHAWLVQQTATGRPGKAADVAALVAFLASSRAGHITGQVLPINGGAQLAR